MRTDLATSVPHAVRWAKRALSTALLVIVLGALAAPATPTFADGDLSNDFSQLGLSLPLDGVGDSPVMP